MPSKNTTIYLEILSLAEKVRLMHCKENPIYVFLIWELCGLSPNFHIHVFLGVSYIPRICPQQNRQTDPGNI